MDKVYNWESSNNMKFNVDKFKLLQFDRNLDIECDYNYLGPNMEEVITGSEAVRDLGVIISPDGSYQKHITKIISKVNQKIGFFLRTFNCREAKFMVFGWKNYIQPVLDYCSQLRGPTSGVDLQRLKNTLKSFTAKIKGYNNLNYWERLEKLGQYSIGRRIERYKILYCWKCMNNFVPNCGLEYKYSDTSGYLFKEIPSKKYYITNRLNSFHYTAPRMFNRLPRELRDDRVSSLLDWKIKLDKYLKGIPDNPHIGDLISGVWDCVTAKPSNSIIHWTPHLGMDNRR